MILSEVPMITVVLACAGLAVALGVTGRIVHTIKRRVRAIIPFFDFNIFT